MIFFVYSYRISYYPVFVNTKIKNIFFSQIIYMDFINIDKRPLDLLQRSLCYRLVLIVFVIIQFGFYLLNSRQRAFEILGYQL